MERIAAMPSRLVGFILWFLRRASLRSLRAIGIGGVAMLAAVGLLAILTFAVRGLEAERTRLGAQLRSTQPRPAVAAFGARAPSGMEGFQRILTPHDDIPSTLSGLFDLAGQQQITLARGEYRAQADAVGGFLRYKISLPVKGQASAIQAFIEESLLRNRSLAFESVQFKREKIEAPQVEARIQWTLFTQLPGSPNVPARRTP